MNSYHDYRQSALQLLHPAIAIGFSRQEFEAIDSWVIRSAGSLRNYSTCGSGFLEWRKIFLGISDSMPILQIEVMQFLDAVSLVVGQSALDQMRHALRMATGLDLRHRVCSDLAINLGSRVLSDDECSAVFDAMSPYHQLPFLMIFDAGLRAAEVAVIQPRERSEPSAHRVWSNGRFAGRKDFVLHLVKGKGGLVREIALHTRLAEALKSLQLPTEEIFVDRGITLIRGYRLPSGQALSQAFSYACKKTLGMSVGIHGLRHSFAQRRLVQLRHAGLSIEEAMNSIAQELGHFNKRVTHAYYR